MRSMSLAPASSKPGNSDETSGSIRASLSTSEQFDFDDSAGQQHHHQAGDQHLDEGEASGFFGLVKGIEQEAAVDRFCDIYLYK